MISSKDHLFGGVRVINVPGIQGPQGPEGPEGPQGPRGDVGPQGERGVQGPQGVQGIPGPQGEKGDSFTSDARGPFYERSYHDNKPAGFTYFAYDTLTLYYKLTDDFGAWSDGVSLRGDKGDKGDKGDTGEQGETGPQGERGPQGEKGEKGDTGDVGPRGEKGDPGPQGEQGEKGETGSPGTDGLNYDPDYVGLEAERSIYDDYVKGTTFLALDTGMLYAKRSNASGDWTSGFQFGRGPQGVQGPKGDKGDVGPQGEPGPQGERGETGLSANEILMDPDPELYFLQIYGETHGDIIGDLVVQEQPFTPDPVETFEQALNN